MERGTFCENHFSPASVPDVRRTQSEDLERGTHRQEKGTNPSLERDFSFYTTRYASLLKGLDGNNTLQLLLQIKKKQNIEGLPPALLMFRSDVMGHSGRKQPGELTTGTLDILF
eukprot:543167-Hanusia_phi.AAC.1